MPTELLVLSDIHYASAAEKARPHYESNIIANPILRALVRLYRHSFWLRDPFGHNHLLERVLQSEKGIDYLVANGDYSCDSAFVGLSDDAAFRSAQEALGLLRRAFPGRVAATIGDHELGKMSLFGGAGGMRLASWSRTCNDLELQPFWRMELGRYVLLGVTSSLLALPLFKPEIVESEYPEWLELRAQHLDRICSAFEALGPDQRVILFCHDPSALPFLMEQEAVARRLDQLETTFIGHLHTPLIFWKSRLLAGMPTIRFLGNTARRLSQALNQARSWKPFRVTLCPSLTGIQLLQDGGYYRIKLDPDAKHPPEYRFRPLRWKE